MGTIVVGVDGSPVSLDALAWAVDEARLRAARLRVVNAWTVPLSIELPEPAVLGRPLVAEPMLEDVAGALEASAVELLARVTEGIDGVELVTEAIEGAPAHVLVQAAADADLLVVGNRGRGGFKGLLLGSVSQQCAQHATCPVVIVRGGGAAGASR
jgi:nucleotide-binding universal stress UspA family protein